MRRSFAHASVCFLSAVLVIVCGASARAQSCHSPSLREPVDGGFHVGFSAVMATYSEASERGDYQGLIPTVLWSHPIVVAELALPVYRIANRGDEKIGIGDLSADVRVALLRTESNTIAFGPALALSLPTGEDDGYLGMGHVMVMPGLWLRLAWEPLSILAQLSYGRALGNDTHAEHQHHGAAATFSMPRVNPMNAEEIAHALGLRYELAPNVGVIARWLGAVPLRDDGLARQLIGPGLQIEAAPLDASIEVLMPIAGDPFDFRLAVTFGAQL